MKGLAVLPHKYSGFTLVEMMVVLSIVAILMAFAVPSMVEMTQRSDLKRASGALFEALNTARTEAIKRGSDVSLCASSDGRHCDGDWQSWIVFPGTVPAATVPVPVDGPGFSARCQRHSPKCCDV